MDDLAILLSKHGLIGHSQECKCGWTPTRGDSNFHQHLSNVVQAEFYVAPFEAQTQSDPLLVAALEAGVPSLLAAEAVASVRMDKDDGTQVV